ncbi:MAG: MT-A70 family methyltransferase [Phycisphaerales bacterium]
MTKYQIIYADPPWASNSQFGRDKVKGNKQHYPLMHTNDIKQLPIAQLADHNCVLLLWAVDTQLQDALDVITAWGFIYKTIAFTWAKETANGLDHFGAGMWTRKNPEICLLATKGAPKRCSAAVRQLQRHKIREHSRKPDEIRDEIVKLCGDVPRIELFCRHPAPGWAVWGNEVNSTINLLTSYTVEDLL